MAFGLAWLPFLDAMFSHAAAQRGARNSLPETTIAPLRKRSDFLALRASGRSWYCGLFKARYGLSSCLELMAVPSVPDKLKVAFVISKRVSKKAVVRNRIRRRLREALRGVVHYAHFPVSYNLTITPRLECKDVPFDQIITQFTRLLTHLKVKRESPTRPQNHLSKTC